MEGPVIGITLQGLHANQQRIFDSNIASPVSGGWLWKLAHDTCPEPKWLAEFPSLTLEQAGCFVFI